MSQKYVLQASMRTALGRGDMRRMRKNEGKFPAVVYGAQKEAESISLVHKDFMYAITKDKGIFSSVVTLEIDGAPQMVVLKAIQRHPYRDDVLHADFLRVSNSEKIHMQIPLKFVGAEVAPGVKQSGGIVNHLISHIDVKCLPTALPESIDVDLSKLEAGMSIHLSEITLPAGVEYTTQFTAEQDLAVVSIHIPRGAKESETEAEATTATAA